MKGGEGERERGRSEYIRMLDECSLGVGDCFTEMR